MEGKKGNLIAWETIIFFLLNLIFFFGVFYFISSAGGKAFVYEETYAKQIALMIDSAKPGTVVMINIAELKEIALKNGKPIENVFTVDSGRNIIGVGLNNRGDSYSYSYFSNYDVEFNVNQDWLSIFVKDGVSNE
jgi:hypothetical protein